MVIKEEFERQSDAKILQFVGEVKAILQPEYPKIKYRWSSKEQEIQKPHPEGTYLLITIMFYIPNWIVLEKEIVTCSFDYRIEEQTLDSYGITLCVPLAAEEVVAIKAAVKKVTGKEPRVYPPKSED